MRILKADLALQAVAPRLHCFCRTGYDKIGQALARRITSPWAADAAYVMLKPVEWFSSLVLRIVLLNRYRLVLSLYTKDITPAKLFK